MGQSLYVLELHPIWGRERRAKSQTMITCTSVCPYSHSPSHCLVEHCSFISSTVLRIRPSHQPDQNIPPRFARTVLHPSKTSPSDEVVINLSGESAPSSVLSSASRENLILNQHATAPGSPGGVGLASGTKGKQTTFSYDRVLGEDSSQAEVYDSVAGNAIEKFLSGINVTVLA